MKTLLRVLGIVTASVLFAVAGLAAVRALSPMGWLRANNEVAGNYLQTLGSIYAVLLAFVVFVVWQQHNDARSAVESEANEISDLDRILQGLSAAFSSRVRGHLRAYVQAVVVEEWGTMGLGQKSRSAERAHEEIWLALEVMEPATQREELLFGEALARYNDLSDARTHRLIASQLRLPKTMWALLLANGTLTVGSMWLFGLESFAAHALMTGALAGSIAFILYIIADLDNPFWGDWIVSADPIRQSLERRLDPVSREPDQAGAGKAA